MAVEAFAQHFTTDSFVRQKKPETSTTIA